MADPFAYAELLAGYSPQVREQVDKLARFALLVDLTLEPFQRLILAEFFDGRRELLVLLPRGNGKTSLFALVALHHLLSHPEPRVYAAAATADQARILWNETRTLALRSPKIAARLTFRHNVIGVKDREGLFKAIASDKGGRAHGIIRPTLLLVDELHAHVNDETYVAMRSTMPKNPEARMVVISTAGVKTSDTLTVLRKAASELEVVAVDGTLTFRRAENFASLEWALPADTKTATAEEVKSCNPASWMTVELIREQLQAPGLRLETALVYHANVAAAGSYSWLTAGQWDGLYEAGCEIPDHGEVWVGVDASVKWDSTAVICVHPRADGKAVVKSTVFDPPGDGRKLSLEEVENFIRSLGKRFVVRGVAYDPHFFEGPAQRLSDSGFNVIEAIQSAGRQKAYAMRLYRGINAEELVHDGDEVLEDHVAAAAIVAVDDDAFRFSKGRSGRPIDCVAALSFAWWAFREYGHLKRESVYNDPAERLLVL